MSAPGIQLSSDARVAYFEPSVRQYLQEIQQQVASNNLPAALQTFEQLDKTVHSSVSANAKKADNQFSTQLAENLQHVGKALESGDLTGAAQAVNALRQQLSVSPLAEQNGGESSSDNAATGSAEESSDSESTQKLNLRV